MAVNPRAAIQAANYAKNNALPQQVQDWYNAQVQPAQQTGMLATASQPPVTSPVTNAVTTQASPVTATNTANTPTVPASTSTLPNAASATTPVANSETPAPTSYTANSYTPATIATPEQWNVDDSQQAKASTYQAATLGDPTKWTVDKNQTSAGQLENIIDKDGSLMQLARTRGLQEANKRGLLNSSMGIGAAQDSIISAATPFAQQDADTYAKSAGYNAETANKFAIENAGMLNDAGKFNAAAQQDVSKYNADVNSKSAQYNADTANTINAKNADIQNAAKEFDSQAQNRASEFNATNEFNKQQSLFEANVKASLAQIDNEAGFDKQSQQMYAGLSDTLIKGMNDINQDVNMDQQSKDYAIKQLYDTYKSQVSLLSAVGSIPDVSTLLTEDKTDDEVKQETDQEKADKAAKARAKEANRLNAINRISKNKKANEQDVIDGFAEYNSVGQPVFKADFLKADADARKAANKKPTAADFRNGFATKVKNKLVWK